MRRLLAFVALLGIAAGTRAQTCAEADAYCIKLEPSGHTFGARAAVRLIRPPTSPFIVDVDRDGRHRYVPEFVIDGLPDPATLGDYAGYVAWIIDPNLRGLQRLGEVGNGVHRTGPIARNKYMLWVSAESDLDGPERLGPLVLRGLSASTRMEAHSMMGMAAFAAPDAAPSEDWPAPPMPPGIQMVPGMASTRPSVSPYLPNATGAPRAAPTSVVSLASGDTLRLTAGLVQRQVAGRLIPGAGFNGQIPGPLLRVERGAEVFVELVNELDEPTAVHWHGLRLENAFDGVPGLTQDPVLPGERFLYQLRFPDAGLYWYHPHHREDIQQDLGLYGNMMVDAGWLPPAGREAFLMLDDLLLGDGGMAHGSHASGSSGLIPYGLEAPNFALMGRFGNHFLTNGEPSWDVSANPGETVRLFLTNVSNTRTFNWSVEGHALRVVATDVGPFREPVWTESVVIAPAERYVVDLDASGPGRYAITNRVQSIDHARGIFFPSVDTLGFVDIGLLPGRAVEPVATVGTAEGPSLEGLELEGIPALTLELRMRSEGLPAITEQMMRVDRAYFNPVEWSGTMPHMNWSSTGQEVEWILRDTALDAENMEISWRFRVGDLVRVRLINREDAKHAMQHPIHMHGQRFLVLSVNGEPNAHLAWKDTALVPVGAEVEVLLELSNPGRWMIHCHIAEHLASGMRMVFEVDP